MFRAAVLALLTACEVDNNLKPSTEGSEFDPGGPVDTAQFDTDDDLPPEETCNGMDDDGDGLVDEDFEDSDNNGVPDCMEQECPTLDAGEAGTVPILEACRGETEGSGIVDDPWDVEIKWTLTSLSSVANTNWSATTPVIGNLDDDNGDGEIDEDDDPEVVVNIFDTGYISYIAAIDGATGTEKWSWSGAGFASGVAVADVDGDGYPDVLAYDEAYRPVAIEGDGTLKWRSSTAADPSALPLISVADLAGDGHAEVVADRYVLDGATGTRLWQMDPGSDWYRIAAVADADLDGDQEVFFAGKAYDSDGTELWDSGENGPYGFWPIVIQADADAEAEIGFVGSYWTLLEHDGTEIYRTSYNSVAQPGPPCAGDFDGDGVAEVAWGAYENFVMYELDGTRVWSVRMNDLSGLAGCSGYDVDGDGALEILFADETTFKILDGATGSTNYSYSYHMSGTAFEYPSVADIDHDGHAEILFVSNFWSGRGYAALTALQHAGDGWPAAGSTWGIHDFAITNIGSDGSVPSSPDPYWNAYNVYRARVAADDPSRPDLVGEIMDVCVADCDAGPVQVAVQVANQGGSDVDAGAQLTLWAVDTSPRVVATTSLPAIAAGEKPAGFLFELTAADIGYNGFAIELDEPGDVIECDEANNTDTWIEVYCP